MSIRMTGDEIQMLRTVIRTSSNCPKADVASKSTYEGFRVYLNIPSNNDASGASLPLEAFVPDVEAGADAAAKMLMYMGLEKYPVRAATFFDYIQMTYEFGKQHRWP